MKNGKRGTMKQTDNYMVDLFFDRNKKTKIEESNWDKKNSHTHTQTHARTTVM